MEQSLTSKSAYCFSQFNLPEEKYLEHNYLYYT